MSKLIQFAPNFCQQEGRATIFSKGFFHLHREQQILVCPLDSALHRMRPGTSVPSSSQFSARTSRKNRRSGRVSAGVFSGSVPPWDNLNSILELNLLNENISYPVFPVCSFSIPALLNRSLQVPSRMWIPLESDFKKIFIFRAAVLWAIPLPCYAGPVSLAV